MEVNSSSPLKVASPAPDFAGVDEQTASRLYKRNRILATGLLGGMAAIFIRGGPVTCNPVLAGR